MLHDGDAVFEDNVHAVNDDDALAASVAERIRVPERLFLDTAVSRSEVTADRDRFAAAETVTRGELNDDLINQVVNPPLVFPVCDQSVCSASVNSCGDFAFPVSFAGSAPQLDPTYFCNFVVHVDGNKAPQACNKAPNPDLIPPADPNGTAPCSGGFCPEAF